MASSSDLANLGEDGFADPGGVKIHHVTKGTGPLAVLTEWWIGSAEPSGDFQGEKLMTALCGSVEY
jgi:hypothetical protein